MKINKTATRLIPTPRFTHEGAVAYNTTAEQDLRRSVMACMLWENSFYESGEEIATRISGLVKKVRPEKVAQIAIEARNLMKLRHVPLLLTVEMAKLPTHREYVADVAEEVIQRADELAEILAIYARGRTGSKKLNKLSKQLQKGIAAAFQKFDEYQLAKYNQDNEIKLRDVLFLAHPKPVGGKRGAQAKLWKRLVEGQLKTPDTWEVGISAAKGDKDATKKEWTRLLKEQKLGALALIRNLRNMEQAGVNRELIKEALLASDTSRVLPFRFVAAAQAAPQFENELDQLLIQSAQQLPKLPGKTILIVDVSGSMYGAGNISKHSDMSRVEAAGALAAIARESCENVSIYATAGNDGSRIHKTALVPPRHGMALVEKFRKQGFAGELGGGGIFLKQVLDYVYEKEKYADRVIVFTDEQDCDHKCNPSTANAFGKHNYIINISNEKNGIGYKPNWTHIDGFSEAVLQYIVAAES
jgi:60 kDa SS-A/Ro ribonucleoprotein